MTATLFPLQFQRQSATPIDVDSVFTTTAARMAYLTSPRRYPGQFVADLEADRQYVLNAAADTWLPIGARDTLVFATTAARLAYLTNSERFAGQLCVDQAEDRVYYLNASANGWILANRPKVLPFNVASLDMDSSHFDNILDMQYASACTYTVNETLGAYTPAGVCIVLIWAGVGQVTIVQGTNCTITTPETLMIRKRYGQVTLLSKGGGVWALEGNLYPAP